MNYYTEAVDSIYPKLILDRHELVTGKVWAREDDSVIRIGDILKRLVQTLYPADQKEQAARVRNFRQLLKQRPDFVWNPDFVLPHEGFDYNALTDEVFDTYYVHLTSVVRLMERERLPMYNLLVDDCPYRTEYACGGMVTTRKRKILEGEKIIPFNQAKRLLTDRLGASLTEVKFWCHFEAITLIERDADADGYHRVVKDTNFDFQDRWFIQQELEGFTSETRLTACNAVLDAWASKYPHQTREENISLLLAEHKSRQAIIDNLRLREIEKALLPITEDGTLALAALTDDPSREELICNEKVWFFTSVIEEIEREHFGTSVQVTAQERAQLVESDVHRLTTIGIDGKKFRREKDAFVYLFQREPHHPGTITGKGKRYKDANSFEKSHRQNRKKFSLHTQVIVA